MSILSYLFKTNKKTLSNERLKHVNEGDWISPNKNNSYQYRLKSGGHGQKNIDIANKRQVQYNITQIHSNGVRTGNYPNHADKQKRTSPNQTWFPSNWSEKDIKLAGEKVANNKSIKTKSNGSKYAKVNGVRVGVFTKGNEITTVFPDKYDQNKRSILKCAKENK